MGILRAVLGKSPSKSGTSVRDNAFKLRMGTRITSGQSVCVLSDGSLASGSEDASIKFWDVQLGLDLVVVRCNFQEAGPCWTYFQIATARGAGRESSLLRMARCKIFFTLLRVK